MLTVIDIETTTNGLDRSPSPYHKSNYLVSVGWRNDDGNGYICIRHNDAKNSPTEVDPKILQRVLDKTTLLIGHNIKFDLSWIQECGWEYSGKVYDTMIHEYVKAGGLKTIKFGLDASCKRYGIDGKANEINEYFDMGIGFEAIPWKLVEQYGRNDVAITKQLYEAQPKGQKTVDLMNEFCYVLTQMERSGIAIDVEELDKLQREYSEEKADLSEKLHELAREALGDTPFKLTSPDDLSMIIFSRKPTNKKVWANKFNLGSEFINGSVRPKRPLVISPKKLGEAIKSISYVIQKTKASQCITCHGSGKVSRRLKSGAWGKPRHNCNMCGGCGIIYTPTGEIAGFKQAPSTVHDLAAHGYKCGKNILIRLAGKARSNNAKTFLTKMVRLNAVTSYLDTYIAGIRSHVGRDGILHTQFMQCVTATGRLSSRAPNFHNQPRGGTFPIRKVVVSRWKGGTITEGDYAQLEFRVAAALAKCSQAKADILDGIDIHQRTADILTKMGQKTTRQDAKEHTFKPLYGGTTGSKAEKEYYKWFSRRYVGIARWHKKILDQAVVYKRLVLPSERVYKFPWCNRSAAGGISGATKIKNYPVQGFATADIVPIACTKLYHLMKEDNLKSLLINEVHDSIVVDTYPGEEDGVMSCMSKAMLGVIDELDHRFNFTFNIPLLIEIKRGKNWLEMEKIFEG